MAAAVADFRPAGPIDDKIKKTGRDRLSIDLEPTAVQHNLAAYDNLRRLSPEARSRAIRALVTNAGGARSS